MSKSLFEEKVALHVEPTNATAPSLRYKLLGATELSEMPSISWSVKGLLPQVGVGLFYGASAAGKSFLLLDLACCIAEGLPWFGFRTIKAPVIYLCLEGSAGFVSRVKAWEIGHGRSFPENVTVVLQAFNLLEKTDVRDLIDAVMAQSQTLASGLGPPLVIVDTLNRAMPGSDESSSQGMGLVLQACSLIAQSTGGLTLLAHHIGKDSDRGPRGHSSLVPTVEASILVSRSREVRTWETKKVKDGIDGIKKGFTLETVNMGVDSDGENITSCIVNSTEDVEGVKDNSPRLPKALRIALEALHLAHPRDTRPFGEPIRASIDSWRSKFYGCCTAGSDSGQRNAFNRARKDLKDLKFILELDDVAIFTKAGLVAAGYC